MLLISHNKDDDFDVVSTSSRYSSSPSSDRCSSKAPSATTRVSSCSSAISDVSQSAHSNSSLNHHHNNNKVSVLNTKKGLSIYLNYNQAVIDSHLKGISSADLQTSFEIRKVLLIGACRKMKDLIMHFTRPLSNDASECLYQHIEFAASEAKKLALQAQSLYIGGMHSTRTDSNSSLNSVECVRQAETLQEIVSELYVSVCECRFGSFNSKRVSSFPGNLSPKSSNERFYFDIERACQALNHMDEELHLEKGITILLLRKTISYRAEHSMNIISPSTTECEIQSDREFLISIGLIPKEFESALFKFVSDRRGSSVTNMEKMFSNL